MAALSTLLIASSLMLAPQPVAPERTIEFSGRTWTVRHTLERSGPGPNFFDSSEESVRVDEQGNLRLRIRQTPRGWTCAEVAVKTPLGYGTYTFVKNSPASVLDDNMVLGMFTYLDDLREIDIELARWGVASAPIGNFVVQPYTLAGNVERFELPMETVPSTFSFTWKPDEIHFVASQKGFKREWVYRGVSIPKAAEELARINFWLMKGLAPKTGKEVEIVLSRFEFKPLP